MATKHAEQTQPPHFFFPVFRNRLLMHTRRPKTRETLFVVVGLVLFLPRFTQTRMSMQVAYDQTGPAAEVREHANSSLSANRSGPKGRKKKGKACGVYWVIKVARYGALIKRPDKTFRIFHPKKNGKVKKVVRTRHG